jgi:hypothetical protein
MGSAWLWASVLRRRNRPIVHRCQDLRSAPPMRVKSLSSRRHPRTPVVAMTASGMLVTFASTLKSNNHTICRSIVALLDCKFELLRDESNVDKRELNKT